MQLTKHHGLGNDFLVGLVDEVPNDGPRLARSWCDRSTGIGADGLIFGTAHDEADLQMTLFNADGSLAEISGNGIRCLAQAEARRRGVSVVTLEIDTAGGLRPVEVSAGPTDEVVLASVDMGPVTAGPALPDPFVPGGRIVAAAVETAAVGNPHVVLHVEDLSTVSVSDDGPALESLFMPEGINVHFARVSGADEITVQHWERGVGYTNACGSGATVSATIFNRWGLVGPSVRVVMPGGEATIEVGPEQSTLIGPAAYVGRVELELPRG